MDDMNHNDQGDKGEIKIWSSPKNKSNNRRPKNVFVYEVTTQEDTDGSDSQADPATDVENGYTGKTSAEDSSEHVTEPEEKSEKAPEPETGKMSQDEAKEEVKTEKAKKPKKTSEKRKKKKVKEERAEKPDRDNPLGKDNLSREERRNIWRNNSLEGIPREGAFARFGSFMKTYGMRVFFVALLFVIVIGASLIYNRNRTYHEYDVVWQVPAGVSENTGYQLMGNVIISYSRNGVSCIDLNGETLWNQSYNMDIPTIAIRGEHAVIYDLKGSKIVFFDKNGYKGEVETKRPILKADIAATGVTAVVLDDSTSNYINYYDSEAHLVDIEIKTMISGDGYPLDVAVSPDGTELMTSYIYTSEGSMHNQVVFRNFEVGKSDINRVVGGFRHYENTLVPDVLFFDDQHAAAVTENSIDFYSTRNAAKPDLTRTVEISDQINTVFNNENYLGLIVEKMEEPSQDSVPETDTEGAESQADTEPVEESGYNLLVYDKTGSKTFSTKIKFDYEYADLSGDGLVVYNESECAVYNMTGVCKYHAMLDMEIAGLFRIDETTLVVYGNEALRMLKLK